jgi:hypothetical protein
MLVIIISYIDNPLCKDFLHCKNIAIRRYFMGESRVKSPLDILQHTVKAIPKQRYSFADARVPAQVLWGPASADDLAFIGQWSLHHGVRSALEIRVCLSCVSVLENPASQ